MSSRLWSLLYAFSSLKTHWMRNLGIALLLSIGVAMPTVIFVWSATGTKIAVYNYFQNNAYQFRVEHSSSLTHSELDNFMVSAQSNAFVEVVHNIPSTVGILTAYENESILDWNFYHMHDVNYRIGVKDCRALPLTSEMIADWSGEFEVRGKFSLNLGEVLVSEGFVSYTEEVHGISLEIGSTIDIDILRNIGSGRDDLGGTPGELGRFRLNSQTIVGIYEIKNQRSLLGEAFPSIMRQNWIPGLPIYCDPVLGIIDSIIFLENEISRSDVANILSNGFFDSQVLIRGSGSALLEAGPSSVPSNLCSIITQLKEEFPNTNVIGLRYIEKLEDHIESYLQSQTFLLMSFPLILMSIVLSLYISDLSISSRREELNILRSKGASYNQVIASLLWESILISIFGLMLGIIAALFMAPLMGSSNDLFSVDTIRYFQYLTSLEIPLMGLITAIAVSMYLPGAYLFNIHRGIEILEIKFRIDEESILLEYKLMKKQALILFVSLLGISIFIPIFIPFNSQNSIPLLVLETVLLFIMCYLVSIILQDFMAHIINRATLFLGQKSLYVSSSLKKRGGRVKILFTLLTLTLVTTTMMVIQGSTYTMALENELKHAIGADLRIECRDREFDFIDNVLCDVGAFHSMPIIETLGSLGAEVFYLEGVRASSFLWISQFSDQNFIDSEPESVLLDLNDKPNGIIISDFHAYLWNKTVGDNLSISIYADRTHVKTVFNIVGVMRNVPGFGEASTRNLEGNSLSCQLGFQASRGGFALVNLEFLRSHFGIDSVDLFFVKIPFRRELPLMIETLEQLNVEIYSPYTLAVQDSLPSIYLFRTGFQGLTTISSIFSVIMSLTTIALLLGPAIFERETEYAIIRALGATKRCILSLILNEFASVFIVTITFSLTLAVLFGYSMTLLTLGVSPYQPVLSHLIVFPISMVLFLITSQILIMMIACYLPARKVSAIDPAVMLRNL